MWSFCWTWVRCLKRNFWCHVSPWRAWRPWFALPSFSSLLSRPSTCHAHTHTLTQDIAWSSHGKWCECLSGDARTPWVWPLCGWRGLSCETAETSSFFPALLWFCVNFCIFALSPMSWMSLVGASVGQDEHSWSILALRHTWIAGIDFDLTDLYNSDILWSLQLRMLPLLRAAILKLILKTRRILIRRGSWTAAVETALVSSGQVACTMNQVGVL